MKKRLNHAFHLFIVPCTGTICICTLFVNYFPELFGLKLLLICSVIDVWNRLPSHIVTADTVVCFVKGILARCTLFSARF